MKNRVMIMGIILAGMVLAGCGNSAAEQVFVEETVIGEITETSMETQEAETEIIVEGNNGTILIGTTGTPYTELLTQAKIELAKKGWDLQVQTYSDYEQMNQDVISGKIDAHLFAHRTYLESYNDVNGTSLIAVTPICYEKYGIYSVLNDDLTKITADVTIAIPAGASPKAKALLFLDELEYLTVKEGVGLTAIIEDIVENPKNIRFMEYTSETVKDVLTQADYCVMGADQAILAGMEPEKEVLKEETSQMESAKALAAFLITTEDKADSEKLLILKEALLGDGMKEYAENTYRGALGLF